MSNWMSRAAFGAALVVFAPVAARLSLPMAPAAPVDKTPVATPTAPGPGAARRQGASKAAASASAVQQLIDAQDGQKDIVDASGKEFTGQVCPFLEREFAGAPANATTSVKRAAKTKRNLPPAGGATRPRSAKAPESSVCPRVTDKAEVMIAIVPDPVHTHLALRFDREIEELENEISELGWHFEMAWLPWSNTPVAPPARLAERLTDDVIQEAWERQPGVLLFRKDTAKDPLIVLLVGDTPTSGVNPDQFENAIKYWRSLSEDAVSLACVKGQSADRGHRRLLIFGPTFVGSAVTLGRLLKQQFPEDGKVSECNDVLQVAIGSGTVSDADSMLNLINTGEDSAPKLRSMKVNAASFAEDMEYQRDRLLWFLLDPARKLDGQIAELTEEESAFGKVDRSKKRLELEDLKQQWVDLIKNKKCLDEFCKNEVKTLEDEISKQDQLQRSLDEQNNPDGWLEQLLGGQPVSPKDKRPVVALHFPREISVLRKAYEQNRIFGFGNSGADAPKTQLRLNLQEEARDDDTVAPFAGDQGAASMEARMTQMAYALEHMGFSVAVISATDVLDEIFVARYLQQHAPRVTVIIHDSDLLFLRSGADASMDGIYVASPYPLNVSNQIWSANGWPSELMLYPSQGEEGARNAMGFLLCGGHGTEIVASEKLCHLLSNRDGFSTKYMERSEYTPPFSLDAESTNDMKLEPPLWLSVIGHGTFQPVTLIDVDQQAKNFPESSATNLPRLGDVMKRPDGKETKVPGTHPVGIRLPTPVQVKMTCLVIAMLLLLHAIACLTCRLDQTYAWSYASADKEQWTQRAALQVGLCCLGIFALGLLWIHAEASFRIESRTFHAGLLLMQAVVAAVAILAALRTSRSSGDCAHQTIALGVATLAAAASIALADGWFWQWFAPGGEHWTEHIFFFYRSAGILNGASPALPLLLLMAAMALWLMERFGKLVFRGCRIPRVPVKGGRYRCPTQNDLQRLHDLLGPLRVRGTAGGLHVNWTKLWFGMGAIAAVGVALLLSERPGPHSLAYSHFDRLADVLCALVACVLLHNLAIAFATWQTLKERMLIPLKQSPLRWGFSWIKGFSWKRLWTSAQGFSPAAQLEFVMRNLESARRDPEALDVQKAYDDLIKAYTQRTRAPLFGPCGWADNVCQEAAKLYQKLADEADARLERNLIPQWKADAGPLTGLDEARGFHDQEKPEALKGHQRATQLQRVADEEFVALVYLSYIRLVLVQIRNRIGTSAGLYILLLWAMTGYPWMNRHAILMEMCALLAAIAVVAIVIYGQMQKDDILSRTTETDPGKLDSEFFTKILGVVGIPALTLIASQFPEFSNAIFSWLVPGLSGAR